MGGRGIVTSGGLKNPPIRIDTIQYFTIGTEGNDFSELTDSLIMCLQDLMGKRCNYIW